MTTYIKLNTCTEQDIYNYLIEVDSLLMPPLSSKENFDIKEYAKKIYDNAITFEAYDGNVLVGLIAAYFHKEEENFVYLTSVSVKKEFQNMGIAFRLLHQCVLKAEIEDLAEINLIAHKDNCKAISLYKKFGFEIIEEYYNSGIAMQKKLNILEY